MILLTKINNAPIAVNCDLIQYIEETPDTIITMTTGDKVVVRQSMVEIIERIVHYRRRIRGLVKVEREKDEERGGAVSEIGLTEERRWI
jgi:flagellar protein FlbD